MSTALVPEVVENGHAQNPIVATRNAPSAEASPRWLQVVREAEKLATATLTPVHLKVAMPPYRENDPANDQKRKAAWQQTVANCILVANQAQKWGADVFAVAAESYVVGNKLGYQGKLIAAVVNARGGLSVALKAMYSCGKNDDFAAVIYGKRDGEIPDEAWPLLEAYVDSQDQKANRSLARMGVLTIRVSVGQCKTDNKMWRTDPEQKLWYTGATKWARRHAPELMVGILSDDDLDRMRAEQRIEQTAAQKKISALIPSSLETTSLGVPIDVAEFAAQGTEQEAAFNPPSAEEIAKVNAGEPVNEPSPENQDAEPSAPNSSNGEFDAVVWADAFIVNIPNHIRAKAKREAIDELLAKEERLGAEQFERCKKAAMAAGWII